GTAGLRELGNDQGEGRAVAGLGRQAHHPSVALGDGRYDRQAQAGAGLAAGIDPGEALEDAPLILRRDRDPLVLDPDVDLGPVGTRHLVHPEAEDRKSTRLNSSHVSTSYA